MTSSPINTHEMNDDLTGAIYMVVGRGTEGGSASYHLTIAGVTVGTREPHWGNQNKVAADSGYSIGAIQVDLGKRGTWPLGATNNRNLKPGESTYVDAIIRAASEYAIIHNLPFTSNYTQLRQQLLSHGKNLQFIDTNTRDSINAWAQSSEGQKWIHQNIDLPQVKDLTERSINTLNTHGKNIKEPDRFETICLLAKSYNQLPGAVDGLSKKGIKGLSNILKDGGDYQTLIDHSRYIKGKFTYFHGEKASNIGKQYEEAFLNPDMAERLHNAQKMVSSKDFNPATQESHADIQLALKQVGVASGKTRRPTLSPQIISETQAALNQFGYKGENGNPLSVDGTLGLQTREAIKAFQKDHNLQVDGKIGTQTLKAIEKVKSELQKSSKKNIPNNQNQQLSSLKNNQSTNTTASEARRSLLKQQEIEKILTRARNEIGYHEKNSNSNLDDPRSTNDGHRNFTKYARDLGFKNGQDWCDTFVDWNFVQQYGKETAGKMLGERIASGTENSKEFYERAGNWHKKGGYTPEPGDQIFFLNPNSEGVLPGNRSVNHTGLVEKVENDRVYVIEGNSSGKVQRVSYPLTAKNIVGYGKPDWNIAINQDTNNINKTPKNSNQEHTNNLITNSDQKSAARQWQSDLNHLGYKGVNGKPLAVDGIVGPQTKSAIEAFQKDHGLAVDGVVGPQTLKALEEAKVKQQAAPESKKADVSAEQASASPVRSDARLVQLGEQILQRLDDIYRAVSTQKPQFNVQQNLNVAAYWLGRAVKEQFPLNQPCSCVSFETRNNKELMHTFFNQGGVQAAVTADVNKGADTPVEQSLATMQQFSMDQAQAQNIAQQHKAMAA